MIFGRYILRAKKQEIPRRKHHCTYPAAINQGPGTLWKCWRCKQVWEYKGIYPYITVEEVEK